MKDTQLSTSKWHFIITFNKSLKSGILVALKLISKAKANFFCAITGDNLNVSTLCGNLQT